MAPSKKPAAKRPSAKKCAKAPKKKPAAAAKKKKPAAKKIQPWVKGCDCLVCTREMMFLEAWCGEGDFDWPQDGEPLFPNERNKWDKMEAPPSGALALHAGCEIAIEIGDYKTLSYVNTLMGLTELVIPARPDGYATPRDLYEAVHAAMRGPIPTHAVETFGRVRKHRLFKEAAEDFLSIFTHSCYWDKDTNDVWTQEEIRDKPISSFYMDMGMDGLRVKQCNKNRATVETWYCS